MTGRQTPRLAQDLLEERRVDLEVPRDDVQAEDVSIDSLASHGVAVLLLMIVASLLEQIDLLVVLHVVEEISGRWISVTKALSLDHLPVRR